MFCWSENISERGKTRTAYLTDVAVMGSYFRETTALNLPLNILPL
jgi:hypothetical protein